MSTLSDIEYELTDKVDKMACIFPPKMYCTMQLAVLSSVASYLNKFHKMPKSIHY